MPAVDQAELDRGPVLPVPHTPVGADRIEDELEPVGREVVDVLLQHQPDHHHHQDVAGGLEDPLVVPAELSGVLVGEDPRHPVVLAQEQHVHRHRPDVRMHPVTAAGEQGVPVSGRHLGEADGPQRGELRLDPPLGAERGRELSAPDQPRLQSAALEAAQAGSHLLGRAVELRQVQGVRGVRPTGVGAVAAQESVGEPLGEGRQQRAGTGTGLSGAAAAEQFGDPLQARQVRPGWGWGQLAADVGAVRQGGPGGVGGAGAERVGAWGCLQDGSVGEGGVDHPVEPVVTLHPLPERAVVGQQMALEAVAQPVPGPVARSGGGGWRGCGHRTGTSGGHLLSLSNRQPGRPPPGSAGGRAFPRSRTRPPRPAAAAVRAVAGPPGPAR